MSELLKELGPVTVVLLVIVILVAIVGGVVVIVDPSTLTFDEYMTKLQGFVVGLGLLAVGRGVNFGLANHGKGTRASVDRRTHTK